MRLYNRGIHSQRQDAVVKTTGRGIFNKLLQKLPFELHIPGYKFCGPGTKLQERLARGDVGKNKLDEACKQHDIAYAQTTDINQRHQADRLLAQEAWNRFKAKDSSFGEKTTALGIAGAMKAKVKLGMGVKSQTTKRKSQKKRKNNSKGKGLSFTAAMKKAQSELQKQKPSNILEASKIALNAVKGINKKRKPRVIKVPKTGGFLIPLFAGLSALGALAGGAAGVAKAVNETKAAAAELKEKQRHNLAMEKVAVGNGLYLKPYKSGLGLFLKPYQKNS